MHDPLSETGRGSYNSWFKSPLTIVHCNALNRRAQSSPCASDGDSNQSPCLMVLLVPRATPFERRAVIVYTIPAAAAAFHRCLPLPPLLSWLPAHRCAPEPAYRFGQPQLSRALLQRQACNKVLYNKLAPDDSEEGGTSQARQTCQLAFRAEDDCITNIWSIWPIMG